MWDWHPEPEDSVVWKRRLPCRPSERQGEAQWFEHGRPIDRFTGTYRDGKREGEGHYVWNENVRFDGIYANDVPQGYGVAQIEGETLAGEWNKGCLSAGGKVAAIGVPRTSCGPAGGVRSPTSSWCARSACNRSSGPAGRPGPMPRSGRRD